MGRHLIFIVPALTVVWIILMEQLSVMSVVMGIVTGVFVCVFTRKFLPLREIDNVDFSKLLFYPFYLIAQIYLAGFVVIKAIIKGSIVDIVTVKTTLKCEALRIILADSITLTPGSILLELDDENMTLLWMRSEHTPNDPLAAGKILKGGLEKWLMRAERKP